MSTTLQHTVTRSELARARVRHKLFFVACWGREPTEEESTPWLCGSMSVICMTPFTAFTWWPPAIPITPEMVVDDPVAPANTPTSEESQTMPTPNSTPEVEPSVRLAPYREAQVVEPVPEIHRMGCFFGADVLPSFVAAPFAVGFTYLLIRIPDMPWTHPLQTAALNLAWLTSLGLALATWLMALYRLLPPWEFVRWYTKGKWFQAQDGSWTQAPLTAPKLIEHWS